MAEIKWLTGNRIQVPPPKRTKKVTGTRFASILGQNVWSTPFEMWCAITKTYEKPFEDTIYTIAGKAIEPKQAEYMRRSYMMDAIVKPEDVFGKDYFKKTYGDFFHENPIFGGMWDYLVNGEDGKPEIVLEMKTSKRVEDWAEDIPEYYALQAALYAWLLGVDDVVMVASFLEEKDYEHPESFVPSVKNTITRDFRVSERYPDFEEKIEAVSAWWDEHVVTGISPPYDEKRDAEILAALRKNTVDTSGGIGELIHEAETLKAEIAEVSATYADKEKRLKALESAIKEHAMRQFRDGDKKVELKGSRYVFTLAKGQTESIDKDAMKADGVYDKYKTVSDSYRLTSKLI